MENIRGNSILEFGYDKRGKFSITKFIEDKKEDSISRSIIVAIVGPLMLLYTLAFALPVWIHLRGKKNGKC